MHRLPSSIIVLLTAFVAAPALAQNTDAPRYGYHHWDGPWQGWFMGPMMMVFFLVILVFVAILLFRWLGGHGSSHTGMHHTTPGRPPIDILKERFAKGEIEKEEFEERRSVLGE